MAIDYTTTKLVEAIKRRGSLPTSQSLFTAESFIALANDEMETLIVPHIMSVREDYFVAYEDFTVPGSATPYSIEIPEVAVGQKLRDVCWVETNGQLNSIPRLDLEQASGNQTDYMSLNGFMIRGNEVILYPNTQGGTLRLYYFARPLELVSTSNAGRVVNVNSVTNEIELSFVPNDWVIGDTVNAVGQRQPFKTKVRSAEITALSSPTVTLDSVEGISVGDWVSLEGTSPIPQIPVEAHKVLAQAAVVKCLEALGDYDGMSAAQSKLKKNLDDMFKMINPRVDGAPKKITTAGNGIFDWSRSTRIRNK